MALSDMWQASAPAIAQPRRSRSRLWTQTSALTKKNWIVIWRHKWWNLFRCLIIPLAYTSYVAQTQQFYKDSGVRGAGHIADLPSLPSDLLDLKMVVYDPSGAGTPLLTTALAAAGVSSAARIEGISDPEEISRACYSNLNGRSTCFGAVFFEGVDPQSGQLNYTLRGDYGLDVVDVDNWKNDDFMRRVIPLQWAIDSTWMQQTTGTAPARPQAWIYTNLNNKQYNEKIRQDFLKDMGGVLVISFVVNWLFVGYHLPGYVASERANGLTELLEAMGCSSLARVLSWHLSVTASHLPSFVGMAGLYKAVIFKDTDAAFLIVAYIILGLSIASWTFMVAVPFGKKPTLAAIATVGLTFVGAILGMLVEHSAVAQAVLTLIFPTSLIIFVHRIAASFERAHIDTSWLDRSPNGDAPALLLLVFGIVNIMLWPFLAILAERAVFGLPSTHADTRPNANPGVLGRLLARFTLRGGSHSDQPLPAETAIHVSHLSKNYDSRRFFLFGKRKSVVAIEDLSFDVPRGEIFCLLGRNGAAKSTALSIIAGLTSRTSGDVRYAPDLRVGIAGQKDVLWDDLDCLQHVTLWRAIKGLDARKDLQVDNDLLRRCDLAPKAACLSQKLSGGQKRKLQLACAVAGGSNLLLLDEISSGLDPLSRRAIWKVLADVRGHGLGGAERATIVLTTHFLDEADYLGDEIAVLKAPGRLLALDSPVGLKTRLGRGFTLALQDGGGPAPIAVLGALRAQDPCVNMRASKGRHLFTTGKNDMARLRELTRVLARMRTEDRGMQYAIGSTTLEDVFIELNREAGDGTPSATDLSRNDSAVRTPSMLSENKFGDIEMQVSLRGEFGQLALSPGEKRVWWRAGPEMAASVVHKRLVVLRRAWLIPVAAIVAIVLASSVPLVFMNGRVPTCTPVTTTEEGLRALTYPYSLFANDGRWTKPLFSGAGSALGNWTTTPGLDLRQVDGTQALEDAIRANIRNETFGGVAVGENPLVAYEGDPERRILQVKGLSVLNLYSNAVFQTLQASPEPFRIRVSYEELPYPDFGPTGDVLLWITFFGMVMAIWPAFAAIYPSTEKRSGVRINQYSNGATPGATWAGHLLFELPSILIVATIVTIACAGVGQFTGLGQLWVCIVLYGLSSTCYAFLLSLYFKTSFGAWAAIAAINGVVFLYYVVLYQVIMLSESSNADKTMTIAHYGYAALHPVASMVRAAFVSVNVFNLLCDGRGGSTTKDLADISLYGAPVVYMIGQGVLAFTLLVWLDSGRPIPHWMRRSRKVKGADPVRADDVLAEKTRVEGPGAADALVVRRLTKQFEKKAKPSVDDVSFGVSKGDTFALIGPNGAGKTTTLGCMRGVTNPTKGDVTVMGYSIVRDRNLAREAMGVCPQHSAIDVHLTVRQHLWFYGRIKGVPRWALARDVDALLAVSGLTAKSNELANSLSGGNQRKLSLACALIGDKPVLLVDEFSSGVDPFSKREAWQVLETLTRDRAVVMTTHSMEEVDALSNRVGIIASKLLAVGTPASLKSRYATYEVHVHADDVQPLLEYMHERGFNSAHVAQDTLTRISVPGVREDELDALLGVLRAAERELGLGSMTLHEASTEAAFLAIVRENNVQEENTDEEETKKRKWWQRKKNK